MAADTVLIELAVEVELIIQTHSLALVVFGNSSLVHIITDDPSVLNLLLPSMLPADMCTGAINNCLAGFSISTSVGMSVSMSISMFISRSISVPAGVPASMPISLPTSMASSRSESRFDAGLV